MKGQVQQPWSLLYLGSSWSVSLPCLQCISNESALHWDPVQTPHIKQAPSMSVLFWLFCTQAVASPRSIRRPAYNQQIKDGMFTYAIWSGDACTVPDMLAGQITAQEGESFWCLTALHKGGVSTMKQCQQQMELLHDAIWQASALPQAIPWHDSRTVSALNLILVYLVFCICTVRLTQPAHLFTICKQARLSETLILAADRRKLLETTCLFQLTASTMCFFFVCGHKAALAVAY